MSSRYVVAFFSLHDSVMIMSTVEASSLAEALINSGHLGNREELEEWGVDLSYEGLKKFGYDMDSGIAALSTDD